MVRPLRIEFPDAVYHVTARGNARMRIFEDDRDRAGFLLVLEQVLGRFKWLLHAYCLMGNHYHLMIETPQANLSAGMRQLNGVYARRFNQRQRRVGHVLQGRFKGILVDRDSYLLELARYVVLNPVRAGMVKRVEDYPWSSYRATAGLAAAPSYLTCDWILNQFGGGAATTRRRYREFVAEGVNAPAPWEKLKAQCILADDEFITRLKRPSPRLRELRRDQRFLGRPSLEGIFVGKRLTDRSERNRAIATGGADTGVLTLHRTPLRQGRIPCWPD